MRKLFIFSIITLVLSFCFAQQEGYRKSWALIIGINEYQSLPMLSGAAKSAKLIREKLVREFGFEPENVIELYDDQATRENILKAFDKLMDSKRVGKDDRVFVYFAGHGVTRTMAGKDKGYIMPVDGVMEKFASTAISTDQLHEFQEAIPAKHVFFAMDACYSGTIFTRGIGLREEFFSSKSEAIARFTAKKARVAITAGGKDEQVMDLADQGVSIFAFYFMRGLDGDADVNRDGIITSSELADYVSKNVRFRAPQNPQYGKLPGDEDGEFIFIKSREVAIEQKQPQVIVVQPKEESKPQPRRIVRDEKEKEKEKVFTPQTKLSRYWGYGFIGFNSNSHSIKNDELTFEKLEGSGGVVGFGFEYQVDPKFTLTLNLFYDEKSGSFKIKPFSSLSDNFIIKFGPDVNMDAKLSYLTLNPMMKAKSGGFYFGAGLALGFVLDKKIKFTSGYIVRDIYGNFIEGGTIEEEDKIEDTKTRFALPIGAGYDFKLGGFKIFIEARYDLGLTKVAKDSEWKVSSLQFLIGARYGF